MIEDGSDAAAVGAATPPPGSLRGLLSTAIEALKTRLDLVVVEAEIYLLRTLQTLLWALAALACALLAFLFIVVAIVAALWDTHRMAGVLGGAGLFACSVNPEECLGRAKIQCSTESDQGSPS